MAIPTRMCLDMEVICRFGLQLPASGGEDVFGHGGDL